MKCFVYEIVRLHLGVIVTFDSFEMKPFQRWPVQLIIQFTGPFLWLILLVLLLNMLNM
jgi:hypothetical protein